MHMKIVPFDRYRQILHDAYFDFYFTLKKGNIISCERWLFTFILPFQHNGKCRKKEKSRAIKATIVSVRL